MTDGYSDENIALLDQQVTEMTGDAAGLLEVIRRASDAKMLGLAEAALYKAIYGEFVIAPSAAGRRFFDDEDHNDWRDTPKLARVAHLTALATVELQSMIKSLCQSEMARVRAESAEQGSEGAET